MSLNPLDIQMSSTTASLKILLKGSGSFVVPSSSGSVVSTTATIAHNFGSSNLLWQVGFSISTFSLSGLMTPWSSGDGQATVVSTVDDTNLYITGFAQTAGSPTSAYTVDYYYRILVP
jgi:hypothetical protein